MSENSGSSGSSGISFVGLLTIVFITLKLCGVISWSWLWVLSPIWIGWTILLAVFLTVFSVMAVILILAVVIVLGGSIIGTLKK
jgi:hypothetical protein